MNSSTRHSFRNFLDENSSKLRMKFCKTEGMFLWKEKKKKKTMVKEEFKFENVRSQHFLLSTVLLYSLPFGVH